MNWKDTLRSFDSIAAEPECDPDREKFVDTFLDKLTEAREDS